jgi:hypothetical protein
VSTQVFKEFGPAAHRHLNDATWLEANGRHVNADHLAGAAAECGLKAILIDFFGGHADESGRPHFGNKKMGFHLPRLWAEIATTAQGRSASSFSVLLSEDNPFETWDIAERYSDGAHISTERTKTHIKHARRILALHQLAEIDRANP